MRRKDRSSTVAVVPASREQLDHRMATTLVAAGYVQPYQLDGAGTPAEGSLAEHLVESGLVTEEQIASAQSSQYGVELLDFRDLQADPAAVTLLPAARARELRVLPLVERDGTVALAVDDAAPERVAALTAELGRPVMLAVVTRRNLERALFNEYKETDGLDTTVEAFEARDLLKREAAGLETAQVNEEAPVVRVVQMIIVQGLRDRASDIHIEPSGDRVRVRFRIDGALLDVLDLPGSIGPAVVSRVKVLGSMNIVERRRPQDGQISMDIDGRELDIRVSTTAVVGGEKVVMRLLDKSRSLYRLPKLGMPADVAESWSRLLQQPYGMLVCAGPTGGGKTTTLYASLGELNTPERNIMTIEDPVEYRLDSINQIQINEQAGITFAGGLRSILRQDPDVILVGEIRDVDTARIAIQSALTGHMVLSSLHATEAVAGLYRLMDMGIEPFLIASAMSAVVAQRLVRRTCPDCQQPYQPSAEELGFLRAFGGEVPVGGFRRGTGCPFCAQTGFLDRIGVYELLPVTDQVRSYIVDRAPHDEMRKLARAEGMRTLQEQAVRLVHDGTTTAAEVMRSIYVTGI